MTRTPRLFLTALAVLAMLLTASPTTAAAEEGGDRGDGPVLSPPGQEGPSAATLDADGVIADHDERRRDFVAAARRDGIRLVAEDIVVQDVPLLTEDAFTWVFAVGAGDARYALDEEGNVTFTLDEDESSVALNGPGWRSYDIIASGANRYSEYRFYPSTRRCNSLWAYLGVVEWSWFKLQAERGSLDKNPSKDYFVYEHHATARPGGPYEILSITGSGNPCGKTVRIAPSRVYIESVPTSSTRNRGWQRWDIKPDGSKNYRCTTSVTLSVSALVTASTTFDACDRISGGVRDTHGAWAKSTNRYSESYSQPRAIKLQLSGWMPERQMMYTRDYGAVRWVVNNTGSVVVDCDTSSNGGWCP